MQGRVDIPKVCFHKYLSSHVDGLYLDLASTEWDTANGRTFTIDKKIVWEETDDRFYDKISGQRMIKGYGTKQSKEMSK